MVSALLRDPSLRPIVRSLQSRNTPTLGSPPPGTTAARLRTPTWTLPPPPLPGQSATSKEHAPPAAQDGGAQRLSAV